MAAPSSSKQPYPSLPEAYSIVEPPIGVGAGFAVHKARCTPLDSEVVIKLFHIEASGPDFRGRHEAIDEAISLLSHPNILNNHCVFTVGQHLWVVMPFMAGGSVESLIDRYFPDGLPEACIAPILKGVLDATVYIRSQGQSLADINLKLKASNIFIDDMDGVVKLSAASLYDPYFQFGDNDSPTRTNIEYDPRPVGELSLHLAHGKPPHYDTSSNRYLCQLKEGHKTSIDQVFYDFVTSCLFSLGISTPETLLRHPFLQKCHQSSSQLPQMEKRYKLISKLTEPRKTLILKHVVKAERTVNGLGYKPEGLKFMPLLNRVSTLEILEECKSTMAQGVSSLNQLIAKLNINMVSEEDELLTMDDNLALEKEVKFQIDSNEQMGTLLSKLTDPEQAASIASSHLGSQ